MQCETDQGNSKTYTYTIKNTSGYNLKIYSYINEIVDPKVTIINEGEEITKTYEDFNPPSGYDFSRFFDDAESTMGRDSIIIIYNNEKKQSFISKCDTERNPLNFCIYGDLEEIFVFTSNDYQNAEDCNGDCE
jgi:hypothetical protein